MRTIAWLKPQKNQKTQKTRISDKTAAERATKLGLEVLPLSAFALKHTTKPALILGFAGCNPAELRRGISVLATALRTSTN
jgi:GntR family transcriptional regulator/MocR family aminotransferase